MRNQSFFFLITEYLEKHPPAKKMFDELQRLGDIYLIGGVLREFRDNGEILNLRDIDIVLDTRKKGEFESLCELYAATKNVFDGYKMVCEDLIVDVWQIENTWAYREKVMQVSYEDMVRKLPETVFLNMDSILYDLQRDIWFDQIYQRAMDNRMIDIVLKENPQPLLNIVRAFILNERYHFDFSDKLIQYIKYYSEEETDFLNKLLEIEGDRYGREILDHNALKKSVDRVLSLSK